MEKKKGPDLLLIELCDRKPSNFVLEGSEQAGTPVVLDCAGIRRILPEVTVYEGKTSRRIRYVQGSPTIYKDEQVAQGVDFNFDRDKIWIEGGRMAVFNDGETASLYAFLKAYPFNKSSPNYNPNKTAIFYEIQKTEENALSLQDMKLRKQAMDIVDSLYDTSDKKGTQYKTEQVRFLCTLFGIKGVDDVDDQVLALGAIAETNPKWFLESIMNVTKDYTVTVRSANELGVIRTDGTTAIFVDTNGIIYEFTEKKADKREQELIQFFLSPEGDNLYKTLVIKLDAKKAELALNS